MSFNKIRAKMFAEAVAKKKLFGKHKKRLSAFSKLYPIMPYGDIPPKRYDPPAMPELDPETKEPNCDTNMDEGKHRTPPFVQRCVAAITKGKPSSKEELSGAFAKCHATRNKSGKDLDTSAQKREGVKARKKQFVKAITSFKKNKSGT